MRKRYYRDMKRVIVLVLLVIVGSAAFYLFLRERVPIEVPNTGVDTTLIPSTPTKVSPTPTPTPTAPNSSVSITTSPSTILQGDPAFIMVSTTTVRSITFNNKKLDMFATDGKIGALVGIDLNQKSGIYVILVTLTSGQTIKENLIVGNRAIAEAPLGIPDSLGGNTPAGETNLLAALAKDNARLATLTSTSTALWSGPFAFPVTDPVVTDTYGYTRLTGASTISHKGTDFRAPPGTPVMAMNSGTVVLSEYMTSYGNTVIVDHGAGVLTLYMHMNERRVGVGESVTKGELIGLSGETGYAEGPHLHISVKINGTSIDPEKFLTLSQSL